MQKQILNRTALDGKAFDVFILIYLHCDDHICTKAFVELVRKAKAEMPLEVSKE